MFILAVAALCCALSCGRTAPPSLLTELDELTAEAEIRLFDGNTRSGRLTVLVDSLARELRHDGAAVSVDSLTAFIYNRMGLTPVTDRAPAETFLVPRMSAKGTGSCVGLTALYLLLGKRCGLPLKARLLPGHITVAHAGSDSVTNYETLRRGLVRSDAFYRSYYRPGDGPENLMMLDDTQFAAVYAYNIGNAYRDRGLLHDAVRMFRYAAEAFPAYTPAVDNLHTGRELIGE